MAANKEEKERRQEQKREQHVWLWKKKKKRPKQNLGKRDMSRLTNSADGMLYGAWRLTSKKHSSGFFFFINAARQLRRSPRSIPCRFQPERFLAPYQQRASR